MWENLQHNVGEELEESVKSFKFDRHLMGENAAIQYKGRFTLMDLIAIFTEEADKICKNEAIANMIALESLRDYLKKYASNVKIVL